MLVADASLWVRCPLLSVHSYTIPTSHTSPCQPMESERSGGWTSCQPYSGNQPTMQQLLTITESNQSRSTDSYSVPLSPTKGRVLLLVHVALKSFGILLRIACPTETPLDPLLRRDTCRKRSQFNLLTSQWPLVRCPLSLHSAVR